MAVSQWVKSHLHCYFASPLHKFHFFTNSNFVLFFYFLKTVKSVLVVFSTLNGLLFSRNELNDTVMILSVVPVSKLEGSELDFEGDLRHRIRTVSSVLR